MTRIQVGLWFLIPLACLCLAKEEVRDGKLLSLFNVVTFPNDPCDAGSRNGTCYTKEECSQLGGTNDGSCAQGYGVCCTFIGRCGDTISQNNTYFESRGSESGSCTLKICKCSTNVCQLRLDFETFQISGPSTSTQSVTKVIAGSSNSDGGAAASNAGRCLTDQFSVTATTASNTPPTICGQNTGEHMYVDASEACNELVFLLGDRAFDTDLSTRSWSVRVTQLECGSNNLAPAGCTQYFYGDSSGTVSSYNYQGNDYHLADQRQRMCFRREKGNCKLCYSHITSINDVQVSGAIADKQYTKTCCSYKTDGMGTNYDCLQFGDLSTVNGQALKLAQNGICGGGAFVTDSAVVTAANQKTLCTKTQPFALTFQSDTYDLATEAATTVPMRGFNIAWFQSSNNC